MIELLMVCYITMSPFKPVAGWDIIEINNRSNSAAITLKKKVVDGETLKAPEGCRLDEPTSTGYYGTITTPGNLWISPTR